MDCLIKEGKKKEFKYWGIAHVPGTNKLVLCYGSIDRKEAQGRAALTDMKDKVIESKTDASFERHNRTAEKLDKGYYHADPEISRAVERKLIKRYGELNNSKSEEEGLRTSTSASRQKRTWQRERWKPSDDFAWF